MLTPELKSQYEREAKEVNDSLAGYLLLRITAADGNFLIPDLDRAELFALRRQLHLIGSNINQIARAINLLNKADQHWELNAPFFLRLTRRLERTIENIDQLLDAAHVPARRERKRLRDGV